MIIDFEANDGEWFTFVMSRIDDQGKVVYDDPLPDAGKVCVRSLVPFFEQRQAGRKKKYEFVHNPSTRAMERVGFIPEQTAEQAREEREDAWDYAIKDFENFNDKNKVPIPCTRENKLRLMKLPVFDRFIGRCLQMLAEQGVKVEEELRKNE